MKRIQDVDLSGKRVLVRVDFNVPLNADGRITDDGRIRAALPTLRLAMDAGARVIIASHMGRPKGKPVPELSLAPAARRLSEILGRQVRMAPDCVGDAVQSMAGRMGPGDLLLLENLRFHAGETGNDADFARALAALCDVYVNDAFACSHRAHASVAGVVEFAPVSAAGILLAREMDYFNRAFTDPRRPLAAVVGGAKVSTKLGALKRMLERVDKLIIGGAMANTFLKARGVAVGASRVEDDLLDDAREIMAAAGEKGVRLYLPVDAVVADRLAPDAATRIVPAQEIPAQWLAADIGPATARLYAAALSDARTIIWNGPMGAFEMDAFSRGTMAMVEAISGAHALSIAGGGDTSAAIAMAHAADLFSYISTGGGAFLELMEGKRLPGVTALEAAPAGGPALG